MKVTEGSEPAEMWDALGGKTEYGSGEMPCHTHSVISYYSVTNTRVTNIIV